MIRIKLEQAEAERLEQVFKGTEDRNLRDRVQVVLMAHRGRARQDIAADLGIHRRSVTRWLNAFCERGLDGLGRRKAPGKKANIPLSLADEIKGWVIDGPTKQGLDRANWTHEELADHLYNKHGIRTSRSAMQRFCQKIGIGVYRPTYHFERGGPTRQAEAKKDIAELKKKRSRGR
jgi:transposase